MRILIFSIIVSMGLWNTSALAQVSVQESDGRNQVRIFNRDVNFSFFNISSLEPDKAGIDGGRLASYSYLSGATWVNANYRFALRVPFQYNSAGTDRFNRDKVSEQEMFLQDIILGMQNYNLLYLPWDLELYWEGRVYLPTSKNSKKIGTITQFRNDFILSRVFSRYFEVELVQKLSYYVQSRTAYSNTFKDEDGFDRTVVSTTKKMEVFHGIAAWGKITSEAALGWELNLEDSHYNASAAENKSRPISRTISTGPAVAFPITSNANFILLFEDRVDRENKIAELGRFYSNNTQLSLLSFVRF
jgi:hypothetical protein